MKVRCNMDLPPWDGGMGRAEKAALKRAEEAERAFRASKGYEPDTFWYRLKKKFRK
ncbi:hypothetical protein [Intestinimonas timonensis]|uniref:hypothetical protein n=1 Tax=Intestinimonas timonensis TaxID=1689270 RepID=UPI003A949EA4